MSGLCGSELEDKKAIYLVSAEPWVSTLDPGVDKAGLAMHQQITVSLHWHALCSTLSYLSLEQNAAIGIFTASRRFEAHTTKPLYTASHSK